MKQWKKLHKVKPEKPDWYKDIEDLEWSKIKKAFKELKNEIRKKYKKKPEEFPKDDKLSIKKSKLEEYIEKYTWPDQDPFGNLSDDDIVTFAVKEKGWIAGETVLVQAELNHIKLKEQEKGQETNNG